MKPYRLELRVDALPRCNASANVHWRTKVRDREQWALRMRVALGRKAKPPQPLEHARVTFTRYSATAPDPSNIQYSFKLVEDLLSPNSERNPGGLGIMAGDKAANYAGGIAEYRWEKAPRNQGGIRITIEEVVRGASESTPQGRE